MKKEKGCQRERVGRMRDKEMENERKKKKWRENDKKAAKRMKIREEKERE